MIPATNKSNGSSPALSLQANDRLKKELAKMRQQQFAKESDELITPPPKRSRVSDSSLPKTRKPKPDKRASSKHDDDSDDSADHASNDEDAETENDEPKPKKRRAGSTDSLPKTQEAAEARLRRICEEKPSGKCHVSREVHQEWARGGTSRAALLKKLQDCGFDKATKSYTQFLF